MKKFAVEMKAVIVRVWAYTTYPKQAGNKAGSQSRVCIYANDNAEVAAEVIKEAKKSKVEKHTFRCLGEEVILTRYTDSHFTVRKLGKTTKLKGDFYYRLLNDFRESTEWYEI